MLTQAQVAGAQRIRERAMVDACTIRAPGGTPGAFDPATGSRPVTAYAPHYDGRCRVQDALSARDILVAEQQVTTQSYVVEVPASVTTAAIGHLVTVTRSQDSWLVGRTLTVTRVLGLTYASGRRLICTDDLETQET